MKKGKGRGEKERKVPTHLKLKLSAKILQCESAQSYSDLEISTLQALDLLFSKMQSAGFPFSRVVGMSGCGQQHGSIYWKKGSENVLKNLDSSQTLAEQLKVEIETHRSEGTCTHVETFTELKAL